MDDLAFTLHFSIKPNTKLHLDPDQHLANQYLLRSTTVYFCMNKISFRRGNAAKFKPKPNEFSYNKVFCAVFSIVRDNAFINAVIDK